MKEILVVDDYVVQQRVLRQVLTMAGYAVTVANGGSEALEFLGSSTSYDLAILDIAMPDIDGIEVLIHIRQDSKNCQLPVIMLTASGDESAQIAARAAGADVFLTKPASSKEIVSTVQGLIGMSEP